MTGQASTVGENPTGAATPPPDLRLRADRPRIVRLSRTVVWSLGGVGMVAVAFALGYALQASHRSPSTPTAQDTDVRPSADGLAGLPSDYVGNGVPKLGPALPGDLGRAILHAQGQGKAASGTEDHRAAQEIEAAIVSRLETSNYRWIGDLRHGLIAIGGFCIWVSCWISWCHCPFRGGRPHAVARRPSWNT